MRRIPLWSAWAAAWFGAAGGAMGQNENPTNEEMLRELRKMNQRLESLEVQHQADQERIKQLESRLAQIEQQPAPAPVVEAAAAAPAGGALSFRGGGGGGGNLLNPQVTVFIDTGGSVSSEGRNKALNRFNLREVELDLRAAISPQADGVLILAIGEEIESDAFGDVEIDTAVEAEEAYINFHTLPYDTSARLGKFRPAFGRNNLLHTHDLPQVTRPLAVAAFLGPEGLTTTGVSANWLVPNPWDQFVELSLEVINADGGAESPILGGPNADNPAVVAHLKWFRDIGIEHSIELGGSYLYTHTTADGDFDANVFGVDATWQWLHPDPSKFRSFIVQAEAFWADNDIERDFFLGGVRNSSFGAYAFGQYQLGRDWYVGLRGDYTQFPNSPSRRRDDFDYAASPYVTWYITEFLRARLEYQHRWADIGWRDNNEDAVFLQFSAVIGAHPPHPYWVRR